MLKFKSSFVLFGNPVHHSKSSIIHNLFSKHTGIKHDYISMSVPVKNFSEIASNFFKSIGQGANVTIPFKQEALTFATKLTDRASIAGSVNTLKKLNNGDILGDNTDGIGFLHDLHRLKVISRFDKVLLIGAGGAAKGILHPLLSLGCNIFIFNRTLSKAKNLLHQFNMFNNISLIDSYELKNSYFDFIINATSSGLENQHPNIPSSLIHAEIKCYDLFYKLDGLTPFLKWCKNRGAVHLYDGIGMLVSQAAYSFLLWHNIFPNIMSVLNKFKIYSY